MFRQKALVLIQKTIRSYIIRKQHKPRYQGIIKIKSLETQIKELEKIATQLNKDKDLILKDIQNIHLEMQNAIQQIKNDDKIKIQQIDKFYNELLSKSKSEMLILQNKLQVQKNEEEQNRLRKIQEEMEKERKRKEELERQREIEEQKKKQ